MFVFSHLLNNLLLAFCFSLHALSTYSCHLCHTFHRRPVPWSFEINNRHGQPNQWRLRQIHRVNYIWARTETWSDCYLLINSVPHVPPTSERRNPFRVSAFPCAFPHFNQASRGRVQLILAVGGIKIDWIRMGRTSLEDRPCSNPSAADAFAKKVLSVIPAWGAMRLKLIGSINGVLEVENVS